MAELKNARTIHKRAENHHLKSAFYDTKNTYQRNHSNSASAKSSEPEIMVTFECSVPLLYR